MASQPNILIIMVDQLNGTLFPDGPADFLHAPHLKDLAKKSVRFQITIPQARFVRRDVLRLWQGSYLREPEFTITQLNMHQIFQPMRITCDEQDIILA